MATAAFVIAFLAIGAAVGFVAFSGGPSQAREAYLTKGRRGFRIAIPILYVALGIAVPALVLADRHAAEGSDGTLASKQGTKDFNAGKSLFRENCWSCHTLKAAGAMGVTGPNLDNIGTVSTQRVVNAILIGGTGQGRMPQNVVPGACAKPPCHAPGKPLTEAEQVALYVSQVAGK
ncbi:MAG: cytochrome [Thermoleophilaceae bacterium]|jgi:mono/diheme cytochrome c family protein|nr:cytochrome [Thermoleophilaceae bacterium]